MVISSSLSTESSMKIAVYPGSFDPITNGHIDILKRSLAIFDKVIVLVAYNAKKKSTFSVEERVKMIKEAMEEEHIENVEVDSFDGLTVDYAVEHNAPFLIRGLRAVSDFEYEFQIHSANRYANDKVEMVFFMAKNDTSFISSSMIIELHNNHVDVGALVPHAVSKRLK